MASLAMNVDEALLSVPSALHKSVLIMKPSDRVPAILPLDESEFRPLDISRCDESFLARQARSDQTESWAATF